MRFLRWIKERSPATLAALLITLCGTAWAVSSTLSNLTASGAIAGTDTLYVVQSVGAGGVKATFVKVATYINSLFSGSCTATSGGVLTCTDAGLSTSDITTNDVTTSKHGFVPKAPNDSTKFLNGVGAWAVPAGSTSAAGNYPGYRASNWYHQAPGITGVAGAAAAQNVIRCTFGYVPQKLTISRLASRVGTAGSSNTQFAIYKNDGGTGRPSTLVGATGDIPNIITGAVLFGALTANKQVGPGGTDGDQNLWFCHNQNDGTVTYTAVGNTNSTMGATIGGTSSGNMFSSSAVSPPSGISCSGANCTGGSSTYGTWPASLAGSTWTDVTTSVNALIAFEVTSIP